MAFFNLIKITRVTRILTILEPVGTFISPSDSTVFIKNEKRKHATEKKHTRVCIWITSQLWN